MISSSPHTSKYQPITIPTYSLEKKTYTYHTPIPIRQIKSTPVLIQRITTLRSPTQTRIAERRSTFCGTQQAMLESRNAPFGWSRDVVFRSRIILVSPLNLNNSACLFLYRSYPPSRSVLAPLIVSFTSYLLPSSFPLCHS